jgi:hypothetical protein
MHLGIPQTVHQRGFDIERGGQAPGAPAHGRHNLIYVQPCRGRYARRAKLSRFWVRPAPRFDALVASSINLRWSSGLSMGRVSPGLPMIMTNIMRDPTGQVADCLNA